jgi:hypothetical protein
MSLPDPTPFALSLSKGRLSLSRLQEEGQDFDKLSPNGFNIFEVFA